MKDSCPLKEKFLLKDSNVDEIDPSSKPTGCRKSPSSSFRTEDALHKSKDLLVSVCHLIRETSRMSFAEMKGNAIRLFMFSQTLAGL
jgi:hypothetical protein